MSTNIHNTENRITYGIEFEFRNSDHTISDLLDNAGLEHWHSGYTHEQTDVWKVVYDQSCGGELVTPILTLSDMHEVQTYLGAIKKYKPTIDDKCGIHAHIGINFKDSSERFVQNLDLLYKNYTKLGSQTNALVSPNRLNTDRPNGRPVSRREVEATLSQGVENVAEASFRRNDSNRPRARYQALNFYSMFDRELRDGSLRTRTLEFRLHHMTLDVVRTISWLRYNEAFIHMANNGLTPEDVAQDTGVDLRFWDAHKRDDRSIAECIVLIDWFVKKGFLAEAPANYLRTNKLGKAKI